MTSFICEKQPAIGSRGMVVTNHPLASAAGAEIMLSGGNAIDATVASLFALTVVEPMMVGILGGGITHIRLTDGRHIIIDGLSTAPSQAMPDMFRPISNGLASGRDTVGRKNSIGALAIAVPGALAAWCHALQHYGSLPLKQVMAPAIRLAKEGFTVTPYLSNCIKDCAADLMTDQGLAALFLPRGKALQSGKGLQQKDYAKTLRLIAKEGPAALYEGALGDAVINHIKKAGGIMRKADLAGYQALEREPIISAYRGHMIVGPPPPASSGVHIAQMLNLLEAYDMKSLGFGSSNATHLLAEVMKIAFADRAVATADPAFITVPVEKLISKSYAKKRGAKLDMARAQDWSAGLMSGESADTTHLTVADDKGNVVSATQTINGLFGACVQIEGTGMLANNYMYNFDPMPGRALSIAPGKRCFTSMAPMMVLRDGHLRFALGLPGALRIFPSAMQAIVNVIDHGMTIQQAVEAPRIWCEGGPLELEPAFSDDVAKELSRRGHQVSRESRVAGGMNAIAFGEDGMMTGAACWRADGTPVGIAGGLAREGMRFTTN
jgi:gamma-glutamyltranspeptidase / glutathione hydrolase